MAMPWSTLFVGLGNGNLRARKLLILWSRVDRASRSGNSRELPSTSVVPLSPNSDTRGEQAAEKVSHSRRDWEKDGHSEMKSRNTGTPPTSDDVRPQ